MTTTQAPTEADPAPPGLYRVIWRWHFYAALFVAPVLLTSAVTGGLYVFKPELSDRLYADLYFVEPAGPRLSYDEQLAAARSAAGDLEIEGLILSADPRRSTQFVAHVEPGGDANAEQRHRVFFIDPYSGRCLGSHVQEETFFGVVLEIHRTLLAGRVGRVVVELTTGWSLVLLFTGLYLWWPRGAGRRVWWPRLRGRTYGVLRDLHAVGGAYLWAFAVVILATGLLFTQVWGTGYMLASAKAGQSLGPVFAPGEVEPPSAAAPPLPLDAAVATVLREGEPEDAIIFRMPPNPKKTYVAFLMRGEDPETLRVVKVDPYSGRAVSVTRAADLPPMARTVALGLSLHQGKTFGLPSRLVAVATCLGLVGMVVTGLWMWWRRRPAGRTGFPRRPDVLLPYWLVGGITMLGVLLPVVGASMVLILLGEWCVRRIRRRAVAASEPQAG